MAEKIKSVKIGGKEAHVSVGIILHDEAGKIFLMDRKNIPLGWACPAGHVDEGEEPIDAAIREMFEETGIRLGTNDISLIRHEFVPWNDCKHQVTGHDWYVYGCARRFNEQEKGAIAKSAVKSAEAKGTGWFNPKAVRRLSLEPVWKYWFSVLKI